MPREAKPYVERGWYISRPHGTYLRLCPAEQGMGEARRVLKLKLGELEQEREQMGGRLPARLTVTELMEAFLEAVEVEKDPDTFLYYQRWCSEFAKSYGGKLVRTVTKADAQDFKLGLMKATYQQGKQPPKAYRPKTVNHALIAVRRAFNWAIQTDRLASGRNPFTNVELLPTEGRQRVATEAEYRTLLSFCEGDGFGDVLVAMRHTSARPQDIYSLEWPMVDWEARLWKLTRHKGSRTQSNPKPRIIGMNDEVEAVLRRRLEQHGQTGYVFLNEYGRPWRKNALALRMRRLRAKAGIHRNEQGEQFVLYTNRHTFLTKAGADPTISQSTLMEIAGHTDPRTTSRYVHAARKVVADAGRKVADGFSGPGG